MDDIKEFYCKGTKIVYTKKNVIFFSLTKNVLKVKATSRSFLKSDFNFSEIIISKLAKATLFYCATFTKSNLACCGADCRLVGSVPAFPAQSVTERTAEPHICYKLLPVLSSV